MRRLRKCIIRGAVYFAYALLGAWMFMLVEKKEESNSDAADRSIRQLRVKLAVKYNFSDRDFEAFVTQAYEAGRIKTKTDWTFLNSTGFTLAAITTIGYGNITPETPLGQALTIVYSIVGIPISMLLLKSVGEYICSVVQGMVIKLERDILSKEQPKNIKIKTCVGTQLIAFLVLGLSSLMTVYTDKLSFVESLYMWCTTFSTIGFGDYRPFKNFENATLSNNMSFYVVIMGLSVIPYITGLSITAACLNSLVSALDEFRAKGHSIKRMLICSSNPIEQCNVDPQLRRGTNNPCARTSSVASASTRRRANSI